MKAKVMNLSLRVVDTLPFELTPENVVANLDLPADAKVLSITKTETCPIPMVEVVVVSDTYPDRSLFDITREGIAAHTRTKDDPKG